MIRLVQLLVESCCQLNFRNCCGRTALMVAASRGPARAMQKLLDGGAQRDLRADDGCAALMLAAINSHAPVLDLLLKAGAPALSSKSKTGVQMLATDIPMVFQYSGRRSAKILGEAAV
ncbi:Fank1 [Symbiodinium microadriaticum]|nr:Fank1 [Symbiodinium microadriaticum]CAE7857523.1 Fank1 [Symbiodinium sp. KB8]